MIETIRSVYGIMGRKKVDLSFRSLSNLPEEIIQEENHIKEINLNYNQLTSLPSKISLLTLLEKLSLSNNYLFSLPQEISALQSLTELNLSNNKLENLPSEIKFLTSLKELIINKNNLVFLPKEIGDLKSLTGLDLESNKLRFVPKEIGKLKSLKWLYLDSNEMISVPEQIGELFSLERLFIDYNYIEALPQQIKHLSSLSKLFTENNPLNFPKMADNELKLEVMQVTSLKSICCKYIVDNQILKNYSKALEIPQDLLEYMEIFARCSFCKKIYFEPTIKAFGYIQILWYIALPSYFGFCTFKCCKSWINKDLEDYEPNPLDKMKIDTLQENQISGLGLLWSLESSIQASFNLDVEHQETDTSQVGLLRGCQTAFSLLNEQYL